ncbi:two-component system, OmpR family, phosphate regulon sensor histidine kinase PhoR [Ohtaekwangia koreensis]|uniref:histidine kinase n=2 Tax=Ohtaekwangia koreensis TaxID=688867 RepID=A0A1T5L6F0_9BACT|nr:two-component system, OmpR family, phosphate regulon sensor histidine kinase PhoR [Ohtaekwangia koreensis]
MKRKDIVILILMVSSIVLLITLQVFWLQNSYEKAFYDLRRQTNTIFRNTVLTLRDSAFSKNIQAVSVDSLGPKLTLAMPGESAAFGLRDSVKSIAAQNQNVQVYISTQYGDSVSKDELKPVVAGIQNIRFRSAKGYAKNFIVRLGADTLNSDSLQHQFKRALASESLAIPFTIKHIQHIPLERSEFFPDFGHKEFIRERGRSDTQETIFSDTLHSEPVRLNPAHHYTASMTGIRSTVLAEITPQILFSAFLTITILIAFIVMYLNIRSQQRLMALKNDFISNVTHELKTPVATVSVAIEALRSFQAKSNPKLAAEYLDIAQSELNRLTLMTDKILKTSIFENHGIDFKPEPINLDETLQQVLASMKLIFEKRGAAVNYIKEGNDFEMQGSSLHVTNVIHNLIDNALKYSLKNPFILITLKNSSDKLTLLVEDRGIGIPKEYHKKIFEKFFRVPTGDVHNAKGYGLGLNYVASVIKSHGGKIEVESEVGVGSLFRIALPKY